MTSQKGEINLERNSNVKNLTSLKKRMCDDVDGCDIRIRKFEDI